MAINEVISGAFKMVEDPFPLNDFHRVAVDGVGDFNVFVEGDLKNVGRVIIMTVHDLGCSHATFLKPFLNTDAMKMIKKRCTIIHVDLPGQGDSAQAVENGLPYPGMTALGDALKTVLTSLEISCPVVGLAEGAGANILVRFALQHPDDVLALCLSQCTIGQASIKENLLGRVFEHTVDKKGLDAKSQEFLIKHHFGKKVKKKEGGNEDQLIKDFIDKVVQNRNGHNLKLFTESFRHRRLVSAAELNSISAPMLLITGKNSYFREAVISMKEKFKDRTIVNLLEISDVSSPLEECPQSVADGIQFFLQGRGLLAAVPMRKKSSLSRGISMESADAPRRIDRLESECSQNSDLTAGAIPLEAARDPDHVVTVAGVGDINIYIDPASDHCDAHILTVHDLGNDHWSMSEFVNSSPMKSLRTRITFIHVDLPGQEDNAPTLPTTGKYPGMTALGGALKDVIDAVGVIRVIGLGEGAGANILARFALQHPDSIYGLCLIHASSGTPTIMENLQGKMLQWNVEHLPMIENFLILHRYGPNPIKSTTPVPQVIASISDFTSKLYNKRNHKNLKAFVESFKSRRELTKQDLTNLCGDLKTHLMLVSAKDSKFNSDMHEMKKKLFDRKDVSVLEISDIANPFVDGQQQLAEGLQYFLQGMGLLAFVPMVRKASLLKRGMSMEKEDKKKPVSSHTSVVKEEPPKAPNPDHVIHVTECGLFRVFADCASGNPEVAILTVHDLGADHLSMRHFIQSPAFESIRKRTNFFHVDLPGQEDWAKDLPQETYPGMTALGNGLKQVVDALGVKRIVGIGEGAGANILVRFALQHPSSCAGLCLINCTAGTSGFMENIRERMLSWKLEHLGHVDATVEEFLILHRFGTSVFHEATTTTEMEAMVTEFKEALYQKRNAHNLKVFVEAFKTRRVITAQDLKTLPSRVLLITAKDSRFNKAVKDMHSKLEVNQSTLLEVNGKNNAIQEGPEAIASGLQFFLQGLGMLPSISPRKSVRKLSRGISMETADEKRPITALTNVTKVKNTPAPVLTPAPVNAPTDKPVSSPDGAPPRQGLEEDDL